ncbi:DUF423 domain-containing protein [Tamlana fucoidanivorans]|uniref:DUF423 domain-containing protein n=1 Tax=Allotamlana fucoidanivorans TaxID=2583814 RepID=A0A5C4SK82_9FLAO|nr:DUF423 domain-containing protein [Tamlana fucoidanivorans]TNJ44229.1 DUF423 domain-containing protein [Tamlana fucoidanivorans]
MSRNILTLGAVLGGLSIIIGAFGAHSLKELISLEALQTFETGVKYQMYHALLLLFVGGSERLSQKTKNYVGCFVLFGVLFFSGSIYGLATNALTNFNFKRIGFITPIGGLLFISAWVVLIMNFVKNK